MTIKGSRFPIVDATTAVSDVSINLFCKASLKRIVTSQNWPAKFSVDSVVWPTVKYYKGTNQPGMLRHTKQAFRIPYII